MTTIIICGLLVAFVVATYEIQYAKLMIDNYNLKKVIKNLQDEKEK